MDDKNLEALTYGPKWMLERFANLDTESAPTDVQEFHEKYGDLYPGWGTDDMARKLYAYYVGGFQFAWGAKNTATRELVSKFITDIFERDMTAEKLRLLRVSPFDDPDDPQSRPAVVADFESGKITVRPRTLLDWLAKSLLDYRDRLAICERENCEHAYFVKAHPRQRFCSHDCANTVRQEKKERWWAENRDRFLKKWRQERKTGRRGKRD
jgi:hypothetical protein